MPVDCGSVEAPCVMQFDAGTLAAVSLPTILLLVVAIAILVRGLR